MRNVIILSFLLPLLFISCSQENDPVSINDSTDNMILAKLNISNLLNSSWVDYGGNPVFTKFQNPSDPHNVRYSEVMYDEGKYKMWYTAQYNNAVNNIWYAESFDGISWTNIGNTPVLDKGNPGQWDSYAVIVSSVIKINNLYMMYYIGQHDYYLNSDWSIGLAVSTDGINWQKHPQPVLHSSSKHYYIGANDVLKVGNLYYMFFEYNKPSDLNRKIGSAKSIDGINWVFCDNPIITATLPWEGNAVASPTVVYDDGKFIMVYNDEFQSAFGMATSTDGKHFTKDIEPFFRNTNTLNNWIRIAYPNFKKLNNEYRIYYSGEHPDDITSINLIKKINNKSVQILDVQ